jgi:hypothetical protein
MSVIELPMVSMAQLGIMPTLARDTKNALRSIFLPGPSKPFSPSMKRFGDGRTATTASSCPFSPGTHSFALHSKIASGFYRLLV